MSEQIAEISPTSSTNDATPGIKAAFAELLEPYKHRIDILEKKMRSLEGDMQRLKNRPGGAA